MQLTRRHIYSKFSVAPVLLPVSECHKPAVQSGSSSVVVAGQQQLHCLSRLNPMCLRIHLPVFIHNFHGSPRSSQLLFKFRGTCTVVKSMSIYRNLRSISWRTRISGTSVDKCGWIIDIHIIFPRTFSAGYTINVGLAQACPNYCVLQSLKCMWAAKF